MEQKVMSNRIKNLIGDIVVIMVALLAGLAFTKFIMFRATVSGDSMKPTYIDGDVCYALVNSEISRGDIVIIDEKHGNEKHLIKRVIGLPGETIQIKDSVVYINGIEYSEDYISDNSYYSGLAEEPIEIGIDEYFVLGDNRPISRDSRVFGAVKRSKIRGVVIRW